MQDLYESDSSINPTILSLKKGSTISQNRVTLAYLRCQVWGLIQEISFWVDDKVPSYLQVGIYLGILSNLLDRAKDSLSIKDVVEGWWPLIFHTNLRHSGQYLDPEYIQFSL